MDAINTQITSDGEIKCAADISRIVATYKTNRELLQVLKMHIMYLKNKYSGTACTNKELFMFSVNKHVLKLTNITKNLHAIVNLVTSSSDPASHVDHLETETARAEPLNHQSQQQTLVKDQFDSESLDSESNLDSDNHVSDLSENVCVIVGFVDRWYPGYIIEVVDEETVLVNLLHPAKKTGSLHCNVFHWPLK